MGRRADRKRALEELAVIRKLLVGLTEALVAPPLPPGVEGEYHMHQWVHIDRPGVRGTYCSECGAISTDSVGHSTVRVSLTEEDFHWPE